MTRATFVKGMSFVGAFFFVVFGAWALFGAQSFYDTVATYPPYNEHLIHDIGAFQIGIGAALLAALAWSDALLVALMGAAIGSVAHEYAHIVDKDQGGKSTDPIFIGILAVLLVAAAVFRKREIQE